MAALLDKIKSRGHWWVVIRPTRFAKKRIPEIHALYPILEKSSVHLRGWDFPHLDRHAELRIDLDWIGQESDWEHHIEVWRFYQSGQFVDLSGIRYDWRDQSSMLSGYEAGKSGTVLGVGDTLFRFTEIFELAARLSLTESGDEEMYVAIKVCGIRGRILWVDNPARTPMFAEYKASIEEFPYETVLRRADLIADPGELAIQPVRELFWRFGWQPSIELLREQQAELPRRR